MQSIKMNLIYSSGTSLSEDELGYKRFKVSGAGITMYYHESLPLYNVHAHACCSWFSEHVKVVFMHVQ